MAKAIARNRGLLAALRHFAATVSAALRTQHDIQFNAPWNPHRSPCG